MTGVATPFWRQLLAEEEGLKLANLVTLSRGVLIGPIFILLLTHHPRLALATYCVAAATDLIDGFLARRSGRSSAFGAQLDAVIDNIFSAAILGFLLLAYPGVSRHHGGALIVLFGGPIAYLVASWLIKKRFLMFHFWSAKAGAFLLFCLWPLVAVTGSMLWIPIAATAVGLSRLEQLCFILRGGLDLNAAHGLAPVAPNLKVIS